MSKAKIFLFLQFIFFSALPVLAQLNIGWVRRYNGPGNGNDLANALVVDDSGNAIVTGSATGSGGTGPDYTTIKYKANGDTLWVRRYNGSGNGDDYATALAVDDSGNVYVTGYSSGSGTSFDYATIKYAPNGDSLWVSRYNGPENGEDRALALAMDDSGNVYVTGNTGIFPSEDYVTIKYAPNGDSLWVRRYDGPSAVSEQVSALAVDVSGNVYVTGRSINNAEYNYATIKYAPNGDSLWVRPYYGTGFGSDGAFALALDDSGNVYVTGYSTGSGTLYDYATIKYAPNGDSLWVKRYNGPGNGEDGAYALEVDGNGNVYMTGYSSGSGSFWDYATIKYASNGDSLWVRRYNGPVENGVEQAFALAVDDSGNVYVTGYSSGSVTFYDYATIKYASNGDSLWVRRYNGPGNGHDKAHALAVDDSGNVYVTGYSLGSGTGFDYLTIKYNKFGCAAKAGDANGDYKVNLSDLIFKVNYVFKGGTKPDPLCSGDDNADNLLNLADIIYTVNFVFKGGPAPITSKECCL